MDITPPNYDQQVCTFVFGDTPISGQSNTVSALAAVPFTNVILATFTNGVPGSSSGNFTAFINWGDDSTNGGVVTANAAGKKAVLGSHAYSYPGTYPVYVRVQSAIGASATILSFVTVTNQATPATNVLTVQVTGQGTVLPDYNNAPLAVGGSYSITATPAALGVLTSWTDGNGFVLGTGTNLSFTMYPGMSLTANFQVVTNPTLTIVSPSSGQVITNLYSTPVTITGTASNNAIVTNVWYQVNSGGWQAASGTTNWSVTFIPAYGVTNVFQAYAVNNFGYVSTTNTVLVKYLAGDVLTVNTTGLGSITPNLNGALLPLGTNYALTATPASGFEFTNWTGSITTNGATLKFTMATNLTFTANFADTNKPVVSITNLAAGQRVSNVVFTVMGTASDNWRVSNVVCQINGGSWNSATNINHWTNWAAGVTLISGTNVVQAYAVDTSGNKSLTNTVSFLYIVSDRLTLSVVGKGTLSPNYSNAVLAIGQSYSMTATPGTGFAFSNWTGGVYPGMAVLTNKPALQFVMQSNLVLQANFVDTNRPTVSITNPVSGQRVSNAVFTVMGTASDNWRVSNVVCQINGGGWNSATNINHWTNWSAGVTLTPGTNIVQAFAVDTSGNVSTTNSVSFQFVVINQLQIRTIGLGTISPNYSNAWLEIGRNYSITSTPASGFVFSNWVTFDQLDWRDHNNQDKPAIHDGLEPDLAGEFCGCDPAYEHHYRAHGRPAHDQCPGDRCWHSQRQLESGWCLVSTKQRGVERNRNHQRLDELDHHAATDYRHQHREGVCDRFGRELFDDQQRERGFKQHLQIATRLHQRVPAANKRAGLHPAIVNRLEWTHPDFNQPDKLDRADKFCRHQLHNHFPRPGGNKFKLPVLSGHNPVDLLFLAWHEALQKARDPFGARAEPGGA